ncbi:hypothetical protein GC722_14165 [Auraticoccus sp. F435]|uniref:Uncharacterized protein n=1 Tax=Auraticoccus cholistanensis TaxID=2656650 RepID=A0A6A9UWQ5_9ACTN|nr:hypothetical protein [Auraticoccus cholistanensis]MVA77161.1 hypothetical protein [Auraticoccus cholistanensis]
MSVVAASHQVKTYFIDKLKHCREDASDAPPNTTVELERYIHIDEGDTDVLLIIPEWDLWNSDLSVGTAAPIGDSGSQAASAT